MHSPLQELSADIRFPGLGTEDKNLRRVGCVGEGWRCKGSSTKEGGRHSKQHNDMIVTVADNHI